MVFWCATLPSIALALCVLLVCCLLRAFYAKRINKKTTLKTSLATFPCHFVQQSRFPFPFLPLFHGFCLPLAGCLSASLFPSLTFRKKKKIAQRNPFPHPTTRPGALGLAGCLEARSKKQHPSCSDERESPKTQPLPFSSPFLSHGGSRFAVVFGDVMQKISFAPSSISLTTFPHNECNFVC